MTLRGRAARLLLIVIATATMVAFAGLVPWRGEDASPAFAAPLPESDAGPTSHAARSAYRDDALRRAKVWWQTAPDRTALDRNPPDPSGALSVDTVRCRFLPQEIDGTTPKFRCVLPDGEVVKVKYGRTGEIPAELAATRLLSALGFGADRMYLVPRVRCYGCPTSPFHALWVLDRLRARDLVTAWLPESRYTDFEWAAVERRFEGRDIEDEEREGWAWFELERVDPARGASRTELDALRLTASFLAHWDNKAANQRLVCRDHEPAESRCESPAAIIQDLGATFGPNKVDIDGWSAAPVWADSATCRVSMKPMPFHGSTFPDWTISESGRRLALARLRSIPRADVVSLFETARFHEFAQNGRGAHPQAWADVFERKVREIENAGPCQIG